MNFSTTVAIIAVTSAVSLSPAIVSASAYSKGGKNQKKHNASKTKAAKAYDAGSHSYNMCMSVAPTPNPTFIVTFSPTPVPTLKPVTDSPTSGSTPTRRG